MHKYGERKNDSNYDGNHIACHCLSGTYEISHQWIFVQLSVHIPYIIFYLFIDINVTLTVLRLPNKFASINPPIHLTLAVTIPFPPYFPLMVIKHPQTLQCENGCPNVQNTINHCGLFQKLFHSSD